MRAFLQGSTPQIQALYHYTWPSSVEKAAVYDQFLADRVLKGTPVLWQVMRGH